MMRIVQDLAPEDWHLLVAAGHVDGPDPVVLAAAAAAVHAATARDLARTSRRRPARWTMIGAAATAAVAASVVALVGGGGGGSGGHSADPEPGAVTFLRGVALTAADQQDTGVRAQFWYTRAVFHEAGGLWDQSGQCSQRCTPDGITYTRQDWVGRSAPGRFLDTNDNTTPVSTEGPGRWQFGDVNCDWACLDALPTDPVRLHATIGQALDRQGNPDRDTQMYAAIGDLLRFSPATPALRGALYDVLATIPGVRVQGQATDAVGRDGVLVTRRQSPDSGVHSYVIEYVIDPHNGQLLEERGPSQDGDPRHDYIATYVAQGGVPDDHTVLPAGA